MLYAMQIIAREQTQRIGGYLKSQKMISAIYGYFTCMISREDNEGERVRE
jgi:hypothetical protein